MTDRVMRASDQDRDEAIKALADSFADGRLDHAEFDARMAKAQEATYLHDLDPLFADLPARRRAIEPAFGPRLPRPRPRPFFAPLVLVAIIALVVVTRGEALWLLFPLWFLGASMARRLAWRHRALTYGGIRPPSEWHGR